MAIDWDADLLGPVMAVFGEGQATDPSTWPTYYPSSGEAFQLPGAVFDEQYKSVSDLGTSVTESSTMPVLGVRDGLFEAPPAANDAVFIPSNGKAYRIVNTEPDGHGHTLLILMETAIGQRR